MTYVSLIRIGRYDVHLTMIVRSFLFCHSINCGSISFLSFSSSSSFLFLVLLPLLFLLLFAIIIHTSNNLISLFLSHSCFSICPATFYCFCIYNRICLPPLRTLTLPHPNFLFMSLIFFILFHNARTMFLMRMIMMNWPGYKFFVLVALNQFFFI